MMNNPDPELADFLDSVSSWFDGMSRFIGISAAQWERDTVGQHLIAQKLRRHTMRLKSQTLALSARYGAPATGRSERRGDA